MRPAPYPGQQAVNRAKSYVGRRAYTGMCQAFTVTMFGTGAVGDYDRDGDADAVDGWRKAVANGQVIHAAAISDYSRIPAGVALYWSGGSRGYGHAAVSIGGGQMVTTDAAAGGVIGQRQIKGWWASSHRFLGYVLVEGNGYTLNPSIGSGSSAPSGGFLMALSDKEQHELLSKTRDIHRTLSPKGKLRTKIEQIHRTISPGGVVRTIIEDLRIGRKGRWPDGPAWKRLRKLGGK